MEVYVEVHVEEQVVSRCPEATRLVRHWGQTLYHREDLGFDVKATLPIPFGKFLHGTCENLAIRKEIRAPRRGDLPTPPPEAGWWGPRRQRSQHSRRTSIACPHSSLSPSTTGLPHRTPQEVSGCRQQTCTAGNQSQPTPL